MIVNRIERIGAGIVADAGRHALEARETMNRIEKNDEYSNK
jgi:hypothetical protein